jgi:hypothetical protein
MNSVYVVGACITIITIIIIIIIGIEIRERAPRCCNNSAYREIPLPAVQNLANSIHVFRFSHAPLLPPLFLYRSSSKLVNG